MQYLLITLDQVKAVVLINHFITPNIEWI